MPEDVELCSLASENTIPFEADVMKLVLGFLRFAGIGLFRTVCCKANTMVTNGLPAEFLCPHTLDAFAGLAKPRCIV